MKWDDRAECVRAEREEFLINVCIPYGKAGGRRGGVREERIVVLRDESCGH